MTRKYAITLNKSGFDEVTLEQAREAFHEDPEQKLFHFRLFQQHPFEIFSADEMVELIDDLRDQLFSVIDKPVQKHPYSTRSFFTDTKLYIEKRLKQVFSQIVPSLKEFKSFLKENGHVSKETSFVVGDGDIFCYLSPVCVDRYSEKKAEEMKAFYESLGWKYEDAKEDEYDDFLVFEEDQNFAFAVRVEEDEMDETGRYDLKVQLFCFSVYQPHSNYPPLEKLYDSYEELSRDPLYNLMHSIRRKGRLEDYSGTLSGDVYSFKEIERFFSGFESSMLTMKGF